MEAQEVNASYRLLSTQSPFFLCSLLLTGKKKTIAVFCTKLRLRLAFKDRQSHTVGFHWVLRYVVGVDFLGEPGNQTVIGVTFELVFSH